MVRMGRSSRGLRLNKSALKKARSSRLKKPSRRKASMKNNSIASRLKKAAPFAGGLLAAGAAGGLGYLSYKKIEENNKPKCPNKGKSRSNNDDNNSSSNFSYSKKCSRGSAAQPQTQADQLQGANSLEELSIVNFQDQLKKSDTVTANILRKAITDSNGSLDENAYNVLSQNHLQDYEKLFNSNESLKNPDTYSDLEKLQQALNNADIPFENKKDFIDTMSQAVDDGDLNSQNVRDATDSSED